MDKSNDAGCWNRSPLRYFGILRSPRSPCLRHLKAAVDDGQIKPARLRAVACCKMKRRVNRPGGRDISFQAFILNHSSQMDGFSFGDLAPHHVIDEQIFVLQGYRGVVDGPQKVRFIDRLIVSPREIVIEGLVDAVLEIVSVLA